MLSVHVAASAGDDIRVLESGAQIVSGTPGRVFDMIKRRSLDTRDMKILVLDEADEMLNKGFREQIYDVYRYLPPEIQVILVSATLPHDVLEMTHKFMQDPVRVLVKRDELTLEVQAHADSGIMHWTSAAVGCLANCHQLLQTFRRYMAVASMMIYG